jgi:hypothetical protein
MGYFRRRVIHVDLGMVMVERFGVVLGGPSWRWVLVVFDLILGLVCCTFCADPWPVVAC